MIISGGDSFVYGSELQDCSLTCYSAKTFAALLADGEEYACVASPGVSNESIARRVVNYCEKNPHVGVLVSWTFPSRYEFRFNYDTNHPDSPWYTINSWTIKTDFSSIKKEFNNHNSNIFRHQVKQIQLAQETGIAAFANTFYYHVGNSEYWEIYTTLKGIVYLQNYLKVKNIPYLFTCVDNSIWYNNTTQSADDTITSLVNQVDQSHWFWFPEGTTINETTTPRGFYQWALENKYPMGTTHPLEQAHEDAAKLIKEKFNEMVKKHLEQNRSRNSLS